MTYVSSEAVLKSKVIVIAWFLNGYPWRFVVRMGLFKKLYKAGFTIFPSGRQIIVSIDYILSHKNL